VTFGKLASVYRAPGDNAKALDALRQGQAIMARLTKHSPDNAVWALCWVVRRSRRAGLAAGEK
jgi:hypothetical protein